MPTFGITSCVHRTTTPCDMAVVGVVGFEPTLMTVYETAA